MRNGRVRRLRALVLVLVPVVIGRDQVQLDQGAEHAAGGLEVSLAGPLGQAGVHGADGRADDRGRGQAALGERDVQPAAVLRVDRPDQVAAADQGVDKLPGGLLGDPQLADSTNAPLRGTSSQPASASAPWIAAA
jgi:hypothetical protein